MLSEIQPFSGKLKPVAFSFYKSVFMMTKAMHSIQCTFVAELFMILI